MAPISFSLYIGGNIVKEIKALRMSKKKEKRRRRRKNEVTIK
jgi:hypothetical protein